MSNWNEKKSKWTSPGLVERYIGKIGSKGMDNELQKAEAKFEEVLERAGELMSPYIPTTETISNLKDLVIKELTKD